MEAFRICVVFIWSVLVAVTAGQCPQQCQCDSVTVDCSGQNLTEVPGDLPENVAKLLLSNNGISAVNSTTFANYRDLEIVDLSDNNLESLETGVFYNLSNLTEVSLAGNQLRYVASGAFELVNLDMLSLKNNSMLEEIDQSSFVNTTIVELDLSECSLTTLHGDLFRGMEQTLTIFRLFHNRAPLQLGDFLFRGFDLEELFIINSGITDLGFLRGVKVATLELNDNPLGDKVWDMEEVDVQELYLQRVELTEVDISQPWPELTVLDLAENRITDLQAENLRNALNLYSLILRDNMLEVIPEGLGNVVRGLKIFDLSDNFISSLESSHLVNLSLSIFDLENNDIRSLPEDLQEKFSNMTQIKLVDNPFHCNCQLVWFRDWFKSLSHTDTRVEPGDCLTPLQGPILRIPRSNFVCVAPNIVAAAPTSIRLGDDVTMQCVAKGDPLPVIHLMTPWGQEFTSTEVTNTTIEKVELVHVAEDFNCSMAGSFTCTAINVEGQEEDSDMLIVDVGQEYLCSTAQPTAQPTAQTTEQSDDDDDDDNTRVIIIIVVVMLVILVFLAVVAYFWRKKIKRAYNVSPKRTRSTDVSYANSAMDTNQPV